MPPARSEQLWASNCETNVFVVANSPGAAGLTKEGGGINIFGIVKKDKFMSTSQLLLRMLRSTI